MAAIRTKSGLLVDPFTITQEQIGELDFIHSLSCINRYTGWAKYPFSVGQHTYNLAKHVPTKLRKAAIVHDMAETFFNDLASPVKSEYEDYREDEKVCLNRIALYYKVPMSDFKDLDPYDKAIYIDERNVLFDNIGPPGMGDERVGLGVDPWFMRERHWREVYMDLSRLHIETFRT